MGTWGAQLYDDDNACDLRETIALVCKVPMPGDRLLGFLKDVYGDCDPADEDGVRENGDATSFWSQLVLDPIERCGEAETKQGRN